MWVTGQLADMLADFANSHNIVFNTVKSQCLIVTSEWAPMNPPAFYLNSTLLPITDSYKYLGHIINSCLTDDRDIQKQTRSLYARVSMLKRRFSASSLHTKCMLFNAYCMDVSCGTLHTAITMIDCMLLLMMPLDFC